MNEDNLDFQGFNSRWKSYLIDNIITGLFLGAVNFVNISFYKEFSIYLIAALIALAYKPVMEGIYGATLGKMLINIKVVDYEGQKINAAQALLRSIFNIFQFLLVVFFYYAAFNDSLLLEASGYIEFQELFIEGYPGVRYISNAMFFVVVAELISMNMDPQHRTIHDRIAKTFVVKA
ncbi:MAG: RDD family protein [Nonlabens sp.]